MSSYNGWANWDTWNTYNWLSSDEGTYNEAMELAQEHIDTFGIFVAAFVKDVNEHWAEGIDFDKVNIAELLAALLDE